MRIRLAASLVLVATGLSLSGCVLRTMTIKSTPPGARVVLDHVPVEGTTPVTVESDWDGTRRVTLMAPGHEVLNASADVKARWFDYFPLDILAGALWPGTIRDEQVFEYELVPYYPREKQFTPEQEKAIAEAKDGLKTRAHAYRAGGADGPQAGASAGPGSVPSRSGRKVDPDEPRFGPDRTPPPPKPEEPEDTPPPPPPK